MKKQKRRLPTDNGISVSCRLYTKERAAAPIINDILLILLSMLSAVSAVMTFVTVLNLSVRAEIVIPATLGFCLVYGVLFKLIKKYGLLVFIGAELIAVLAVVAFLDDVLKGAVILYDQALQVISENRAWDEVIPTYEWQDSYLNLTTGVMCLLSFLLCLLISYFTVVKPSFIATFLLTFPFFEVGAAVGAVPDRLYFGMMLASWAASLTVSKVANSKIKSKKAGGKAKKTPAAGARGRFAASAVVIAVITLCIFLGSSSFLSMLGISRTEDVDILRDNSEDIVSSIYDYITGEDNDGSLKEGELLEVDDHRIKNRHYITMKVFTENLPPHIKLKGYIGSVYKNNRWEQLDCYDEYTSLFEDFSKLGYNAGSLKGTILTSQPNCFTEYNFATITLSQFRRKKPYVYETYYGSFGSDEYSSINDTSVKNIAGNKTYTYATIFSSSEDAERIKTAPLYNDSKFKALWEKYGEMVRKEYTASFVTDNVLKLVEDFKIKGKYQFVDEIRDYFLEELKLNYKVNKSPEDRDFVEHFLLETKNGYSTHFATAATVLLQSQNIPARYVEGYFIPQKVLLESETDESGAIVVNVTDAYAHAWIEIFDNELGWIPVEVTPGFWTGSLAEEMGEVTQQLPEAPSEELPPEEEPEEGGNEDPEEIVEINPGEPDDEAPQTVGRRPAPTWAKVVLAVVGIVVLAALLLVLYHKLYEENRRKKLYMKDADTSVKAGYKYFLALAAYEGIDCTGVYSFMDFADNCSAHSSVLDREETSRFMSIYLQNTYSNNKVTTEEARRNADFVCRYSARVYDRLPRLQKLVFKYLKNL